MHASEVGVDRAEGEVLSWDPHFGEDVEEGALAHVGDAAELGEGKMLDGGRGGRVEGAGVHACTCMLHVCACMRHH